MAEPRKIAGNEEEGWALSTTIPEIHDSEIKAIEKHVLEWVYSKQKTYVNLEDFRKEVIDRFRQVNFVVDVKVFTTNLPDVYWFDFDLTRRLTEFDPDRQVHEVTNDELETGDGGVIKHDIGAARALIEGDMDAIRKGGMQIPGHSHGDGSHHHH